jgi:hypothetical protein
MTSPIAGMDATVVGEVSPVHVFSGVGWIWPAHVSPGGRLPHWPSLRNGLSGTGAPVGAGPACVRRVLQGGRCGCRALSASEDREPTA